MANAQFVEGKEARLVARRLVLRDYIVTPSAVRRSHVVVNNLKRFSDNRRLAVDLYGVQTREARIEKRPTIRSKQNSYRPQFRLHGGSFRLRHFESARGYK